MYWNIPEHSDQKFLRKIPVSIFTLWTLVSLDTYIHTQWPLIYKLFFKFTTNRISFIGNLLEILLYKCCSGYQMNVEWPYHEMYSNSNLFLPEEKYQIKKVLMFWVFKAKIFMYVFAHVCDDVCDVSVCQNLDCISR